MYSAKWKAQVGEKISIVHEKSTLHDINTMAGKKNLPEAMVSSITGDIPKEISRYTRYIFEHGARVCAFVDSSTHRVSPLIQGGLVIPSRFEIRLPNNEVNDSNLKKYKQSIENMTTEFWKILE